MVHLYVANELLKQVPDFDKKQFLLGAIAPDMVYGDSIYRDDPVENYEYESTHGLMHMLEKGARLERKKGNSFTTGWLLHLITDRIWQETNYKELYQKLESEGHDVPTIRAIYHEYMWRADYELMGEADTVDIERNLREAKLPEWCRDSLKKWVESVLNQFEIHRISDEEPISDAETALLTNKAIKVFAEHVLEDIFVSHKNDIIIVGEA
jgi:hypothetical protein